MRVRKNLTGKQFGRLSVLGRVPTSSGYSYYACVCECGSSTVARGANLSTGNTASCGCLRADSLSARSRSHGMSKTTTYKSWCHMKERCLNEGNQDYKDYGGRGIKVCERWLNSFECFLADMGEKPDGKYSIDRLKTDGDYCPENCRWSTNEQQARNRRNNHPVEFNGRTQLLVEWSQETGVRQETIRYRLKHGWSVAEALYTPGDGRNAK